MPLSFELAELEKARKQIRDEQEQIPREAVQAGQQLLYFKHQMGELEREYRRWRNWKDRREQKKKGRNEAEDAAAAALLLVEEKRRKEMKS